MGKRQTLKRPALEWLAVFGVLVFFVIAASWGRSFIGVTIKPIVISEEAPQETPTGMTAPHDEDLSAPPPAPSSDDAASPPKQQKSAATPFRFPGFDIVDPAIAQKMEEERQAIRDEVARETLEESVRNLLTHDLSPLFSPRWRAITHAGPVWDAVTLSIDLAADPRIARLLEVIEYGSQQEVAALYREIRNAVNVFLFELPLMQSIGVPPMPTVMDPWSGNALPMLLAAFPASVEHLELLVAMADRIEAAHQEDILQTWPHPDQRPETLVSRTTTTLAYHIDHVLGELADEWANEDTFSPLQGATLDAYLQFREDMRALVRAAVEDRVSQGWIEPRQAMAVLGDDSQVDEYGWLLADILGVYMEPQEMIRGAYLREREILTFAREVIRNNVRK